MDFSIGNGLAKNMNMVWIWLFIVKTHKVSQKHSVKAQLHNDNSVSG